MQENEIKLTYVSIGGLEADMCFMCVPVFNVFYHVNYVDCCFL